MKFFILELFCLKKLDSLNNWECLTYLLMWKIAYSLISRKITTVILFKIESKFEEWVKIFDSKEADLRHSEFDIKPLFRGFSKDDPKKVICIHQAPEGNIQKFVQANSEWIKSHKVDFSSMEESSWIWIVLELLK